MRVKIHFHINGFALTLALTQNPKVTRKWLDLSLSLAANLLLVDRKTTSIRLCDHLLLTGTRLGC